MKCSMLAPRQTQLCTSTVSRPSIVAVPLPFSSVRLGFRRQSTIRTSASAKEEFERELVTESLDTNILEYCGLDGSGKRLAASKSLGEKEQEYLDALRAFYYDGKPTMSNEEFDNLEQELLWQGSRVAILSPTEQRFMEASRAFAEGKPILDDEAYDELKRQLRRDRSTVVAQGPRCSLRSKKMYSDITVDYLKLTLLNVPAVLLVLGLLFSVDDVTGFEITKAIELPEPFGVIFLWAVLFPSLFILANALTQLAFKDALILKGTCPECGTENFTYFGDILTVAGNRDVSQIKCNDCKSTLQFKAEERMLVLLPPDDKPKGKPKPAAKKNEGKQEEAAQQGAAA